MLQAGEWCGSSVFSARLTDDSAMDGRAILELDGDSLVGQLHEEPDELHPCSCRSPLAHCTRNSLVQKTSALITTALSKASSPLA